MHRRPKLAVEDHDVDGVRGEAVPNLVQFAAAHERPRIGSWPPLHEGRPDPMARGGQQGRDLGHVRIEGDGEDVQRSGSGPGSTISVSTGNGGAGASACGFADSPYGGGYALRGPVDVVPPWARTDRAKKAPPAVTAQRGMGQRVSCSAHPRSRIGTEGGDTRRPRALRYPLPRPAVSIR